MTLKGKERKKCVPVAVILSVSMPYSRTQIINAKKKRKWYYVITASPDVKANASVKDLASGSATARGAAVSRGAAAG